MLIVVAISVIIAAISIPKINRIRMSANEAAALQELRTLHTAQAQYYSLFGRYAAKLEELGAARVNLISSAVAKGTKGGYQFTLQGGPGGYVVTAAPVTFNSSGIRSFFSDESLTIRVSSTAEPATADSPELSG